MDKRMIWFLPIEPYEERYTEQWYRWFREAFTEAEIPFEYIEGEQKVKKVEKGRVLDVYGTSIYKATQLAKLVSLIRNGSVKDGDIVFFADLWFPGIETLQYIRQLDNKKFKIQGIFHAGTWDEHDFTRPMRPWAGEIEQGWIRFIDKIYVGSRFHADLIESQCDVDRGKIKVTGLPFEADEIKGIESKEKIVVFPHRLDKEKQPWKFDALEKQAKKRGLDWRFVKTKDETKTKKEYYRLLSKSRIAVSFALQETFGYAMLEAVANGCMPIVPDRLSYAEMPVYSGFRYSNEDQIIDMIENYDKLSKKLKPQRMDKYKTVNFVKTIK